MRCCDCPLFVKRPGGGACLVNPIPRRGITPGCMKVGQLALPVKPAAGEGA